MTDRLAEIEARSVRASSQYRRDLLAVAKAAQALDGLPIPDGTMVVPQDDGVVEMPLTWGYLLTDLRAALANLGGAT